MAKALLGVLINFLIILTCHSQWNEDLESFDLSLMKVESDFLEPVDSYFNLRDHEFDYYQNIKSLLLVNLSESPLARMIVLPSFEREYVISIDEKDNVYSLNFVIASSSIWHTQKSETISPISTSKIIPCELAEKIQQLFELSINNARYVKGGGAGVDGTTYFFSTTTKGFTRTAQKWSPYEGTKIFELIELAESMINAEVDQEKLTKRIEILRSRFNR
ncbi:MAG: hypothetical protein AAF693_12915 [Bacteroidota bacterium]